ncbi:preprotein translocase subunit SecA [Ollibium composti]|uniref:preprotein translocase subunit SecA n=1 Tax=Ollibium composti TaxID=2675109 RepID=UPI001E65214F|nr:prepilin peptidase [Mesorhizobium composti]
MSEQAQGRPLPALERYAERADPRQHWLDPIEAAVTAAPSAFLRRLWRSRIGGLVGDVAALEPELKQASDAYLARRAREVRAAMRRDGLDDRLVVGLFALVREISRRTVGLRHHDVQVLAGLSMIGGAVVEMDTGEGKTLTVALPAAAAAFAGMPVHVVTVNDYLAARDHGALSPVFDFLGLSTGVVTNGLSPAEKAAIYSRDIVYASNKDIAFDYLRDRIALGIRPNFLRTRLREFARDASVGQRVVMRGLHFAIVDEADSVLVDEARTPLIISKETDAGEEREWAQQAFRLIEDMEPDLHYRMRPEERRIELTDAGRTYLEHRAEAMGDIWLNRIRREEGGRQALSALHLFRKGEHYLVQDGKVQIVDEYTGRIMPDRSWSDGLHQLIEFKEACETTSRKLPMARMTYQRFFRRYLTLCGMTGTAREVSNELWSVYRLGVVRIPPNVPSKRRDLGVTICASQDEKWRCIVERVRTLHSSGRPVLIGTRSVLASNQLSRSLMEAGLEHEVLNAENVAREAGIIAEAGRRGRITVATNMAGRGVDIAVDPDLLDHGGLHVILSELHDAGRIDRQMQGRTARRGEPGTTEAVLSMEDPLLELLSARLPRPPHFGRMLFHLAQRRAERAHRRDRKNLLAQDGRLGVLLAFSGGKE